MNLKKKVRSFLYDLLSWFLRIFYAILVVIGIIFLFNINTGNHYILAFMLIISGTANILQDLRNVTYHNTLITIIAKLGMVKVENNKLKAFLNSYNKENK